MDTLKLRFFDLFYQPGNDFTTASHHYLGCNDNRTQADYDYTMAPNDPVCDDYRIHRQGNDDTMASTVQKNLHSILGYDNSNDDQEGNDQTVAPTGPVSNDYYQPGNDYTTTSHHDPSKEGIDKTMSSPHPSFEASSCRGDTAKTMEPIAKILNRNDNGDDLRVGSTNDTADHGQRNPVTPNEPDTNRDYDLDAHRQGNDYITAAIATTSETNLTQGGNDSTMTSHDPSYHFTSNDDRKDNDHTMAPYDNLSSSGPGGHDDHHQRNDTTKAHRERRDQRHAQ